MIRPVIEYTPPGLRLNGARMPSMAEEVATDFVTVRSRVAGSRRYRFADESFALMGTFWQARAGERCAARLTP